MFHQYCISYSKHLTRCIHREKSHRWVSLERCVCLQFWSEKRMYSSVTLEYSVRPPEKSVKEMDEVTRQILLKRGLGIAITEGLRIRSEILLFKFIQESIMLFCRDAGGNYNLTCCRGTFYPWWLLNSSLYFKELKHIFVVPTYPGLASTATLHHVTLIFVEVLYICVYICAHPQI